MQSLIYGLSDPRTQQLRYIGQSSHGLKRAAVHWKRGSLRYDYSKKGDWLRELADVAIRPEVDVIEYAPLNCSDVHAWLNEQEQFWISYWKYIGADLTNELRGGSVTRPRAGTQNRSVRIAARVTPELLDRIQRAADHEQRTVSGWLSFVLTKAVETFERSH